MVRQIVRCGCGETRSQIYLFFQAVGGILLGLCYPGALKMMGSGNYISAFAAQTSCKCPSLCVSRKDLFKKRSATNKPTNPHSGHFVEHVGYVYSQ